MMPSRITHHAVLLPILVLACLVWAGCVRYQTEPLSAASSAAELEKRTLDDAELKHSSTRMERVICP